MAYSTALKYSKLCATDDSRLLLVCDVALGRCKDVHKRDLTLTQAPEEYDSVHGVRKTPCTQSDFVVKIFVTVLCYNTVHSFMLLVLFTLVCRNMAKHYVSLTLT